MSEVGKWRPVTLEDEREILALLKRPDVEVKWVHSGERFSIQLLWEEAKS